MEVFERVQKEVLYIQDPGPNLSAIPVFGFVFWSLLLDDLHDLHVVI